MTEHPLSTMEKLDPEFMARLRETDALVYADGALPRKIKLLIAMAFDAAEGTDVGVRALAGAALRAGATRAEISEVLRVAFHLSGIGTLYTASKGLKDVLC
jgi:alkylhydroperoxidase/carboxymuconolactone decarboxylase family protein YurZ